MAVGPHPLTAEAAVEVLRAGGNAFDAAVAAAMTEGVVEPAHNGVAGYGGGMVGFRGGQAGGEVVCVDFNAEAPGAARPDMFPVTEGTDGTFTVPGAVHKTGALSVAVPGIVAGLERIHREWGSLPLAAVLAPAVRAARDGWVANRLTCRNLRENWEAIRGGFPETARLVAPTGSPPEAGQRLTNPELAETLEELAAVGLRDFYEGELAVRLVESVRRQGGVLELEDMAAYQARRVAPTEMDYRGRRLHTPPAGCGGFTSLQVLAVLDGFDLVGMTPVDVEFLHLYLETLKVCWSRRLAIAGDPAFTPFDEAGELAPELVADLRARVARGRERPEPGQRFAPEPFHCTSHLCVADVHGNVLSLTQTHGGAFGSYVSVPGTGLILGHGMARFDPRPGRPNSIAPRKRPLHNMAPFLVTRGGSAMAAYGTPGGRTIVNNQAFFTLGLFAFGLELGDALACPRLHCEEAEPASLEESAGAELLDALRARGHGVNAVERNGGPASGIMIEERRRMQGAVDPRGDGTVAWE